MGMISFHGSFYAGDSFSVVQVLRSWLSAEDLAIKNRHGLELRYENDDIEILCYESMLPEDANFYLLEGHIDGAVETATATLRRLAEQCRLTDVRFGGEYEEVDEGGNPIGDEIDIG